MSLDYLGVACLLNSAKAELLIDACDLDAIGAGIWTVRTERTGHKYAVRFIGGRYTRLHRLLTGAKDGLDVDHIDRNGLNNTKKNLRVCTRSENNCNQAIRKSNKSGLKCVYRHCKTGEKQWRCRIKFNGAIHDLGLFKTKEDAYAAYLLSVHEFHGNFTRVV